MEPLPDTHPHEAIRAIAARVMALEQAHLTLNDKVDANTRLTSSIKEDTGDLVEFAKAAKGFLTLAKWVGRFVAWATPIGAAAWAIWSAIKGQRP